MRGDGTIDSKASAIVEVVGAQDFRFTTKGDALYAICLAGPDSGTVTVKSLESERALRPQQIRRVEVLGGGTLKFERTTDGLTISRPERDATRPEALAFKIV